MEPIILEFLKLHTLAVISTISKESTPQSAVIGFGETEKLEIIFGTDSNSRKYRNILNNPVVSIVVGWDDNKTLQYEGSAELLEPSDVDFIRKNYWDKNPGSEKYHETNKQVYFIVRPKWMRLSDLNSDPWDVNEIDFK